MNPTRVTSKSSLAKHPIFEFQGIRFHRQPDSGYYFRIVDGRKRYLHREVWSASFGTIPQGHHIHHRNEDRADNRIENLECLPGGRHVRMHTLGGCDSRRAGLRRRREKSGYVDLVCGHCGRVYQCLEVDAYKSSRCSRSCVTAARVASGVDDVDASCAHCGQVFRKNRYRKNKYCSLGCGYKARRRAA